MAVLGQVALAPLDLAVFAAYMLATVAVGFWVARRGRGTAENYFLGGKSIPWYVVAASMVATNISSEHFIANVGIAYRHGVVPATGSWNTWIIYSLLIWVFLPYYVRSGIFTMPQFLERRYNAACRYLFAVALVVGYVLAIIAQSLFAGALVLYALFGIPVGWGIAFFAVATGAYTIYGGLRSAAWTDFLQMVVLLLAGVLVPILGLIQVGGLGVLIREHPEKFQILLPMTHKPFPFTGILTGFLTVGIWYSCASQHIVQRALSAKDEWHARMGVVGAGYLHLITPFFFVVPGVIAYHLYPDLPNPDTAYLTLVKELVPAGLRGLILAGVAAALMSTLSTVLNSSSTLITIDLYKRLREASARQAGSVSDASSGDPAVTEREQLWVGQASGVVVLAIGVAAAFHFMHSKESLFVLIQNIFFYIAPPFAVVFTLGLLWRRANGPGAVVTILAGFPFTYLLERYIFPGTPLLAPYNTYLHRALLAWVFCMTVMVVVSLLTAPPPAEKTEGIIWSRRYARLPDDLQRRYSGWKDFRLWWLLFVASVLILYGVFLWWRLEHPVDMIHGP